LGELDNDKRIVFSLKIFHEKSYEEISAITGHSIGKLKTDLHRARLEMRKRIAPYLSMRAASGRRHAWASGLAERL
jgi:RNA polymerase sigma-70 factor, ECF subfamily